MHQSVVITRYLGNKFGLTPKDPKDALQCEMLGDTITDLRNCKYKDANYIYIKKKTERH
jgi:glutathione S-transferase